MSLVRISGLVLLGITTALILFLIATTVNHEISLRKEAKAYLPPGSLVEVNGKKLHVYAEGEGDVTLVFMAGHGTSSPTLDFQPLWMRMIAEHRIAVVERSGYGWSETSDSPRDIDTVLEETRDALELSGERGPFVLVPHSMSGLEAIYWAQKYPDEVTAIIGLDPLVPDSVELLPEPQNIQLYFMYIISRIGLSRLMPESDLGGILPLIKSSELSEDDRNPYLAMFYRSAFTKDMLREVGSLKANARAVAQNEIPFDTPMFFFLSDDQEASVSGWQDASASFLARIRNGAYLVLDAGHYVHHDKADVIAELAKEFVKEIE